MARFLCACLVGLLSLSVLTAQAARQKPVVRPASAQDVFVKGGTTLDIDRHWGEILDVPGGRTTLPVTHKSGYSFARVGGMIKTAINSNPAKYAATAAVTYLISQLPGASFDPQTGELLKSPDASTTLVYWTTDAKPGFRYTEALAACKASHGFPQSYFSAAVAPYTTLNCHGTYQLGDPGPQVAIVKQATQNCPNGYTGTSCNSQPLPAVPFAPSDFDQLVSNVPNFSPELWGEIGPMLLSDIPATFDGPDSLAFDGPASVTGTPTITTTLDQVSGTSTVVESTPVHNFDFSTNPLSITTTTTTTNNTYQNGTLVSTTTQTQGQPSTEVSEVPAQLEIPTDCDFMPTVCSFIDWVQTPFNGEEPDLSQFIADEDYTKDFNVNSNASCPAPAILETAFGSFELSYEPACMWAGMIKPFVLMAALISAIFISLGAIRGSD